MSELKTLSNTLIPKKRINLPTYLCCWMYVGYGVLVLMIGYTQSGLAGILFNSSTKGNMPYALLSQSIGLIFGTLVINLFIKKINIRWMYMIGYAIATLGLIFIAFIDKLGIPLKSTNILIFFIFLEFLIGCGIGPTTPLTSTYLSARYQGHQKDVTSNVSAAFYAFGGGLIPLIFANQIISIQTTNNGALTFDSVRYFYYIAIVIGFSCAVSGFFINYKHTQQLTSSKIIHPKEKRSNFPILMPLCIAVALMIGFRIVETITNYMFVNFAEALNTNDFSIHYQAKVYATQAFGLSLTVMGIWRIVSGLWLVNKLPKGYFIGGSFILTAITYFLITAGLLKYLAWEFILACLMGISFGNGFPLIYAYAIDIDPRRATFIGMVTNIGGMIWIALTQLSLAIMWQESNARGSSEIGSTFYYAPMILGGVVAILFALIALASSSADNSIFSKFYYRKKHIKLPVF